MAPLPGYLSNHVLGSRASLQADFGRYPGGTLRRLITLASGRGRGLRAERTSLRTSAHGCQIATAPTTAEAAAASAAKDIIKRPAVELAAVIRTTKGSANTATLSGRVSVSLPPVTLMLAFVGAGTK